TTTTRAEVAAETLEALDAEGAAGVVLIQDDLHRALPAATRRRVARAGLLLLVPFAAPPAAAVPGEPEAGAEVVELLRRAVGYRVRLG
ncbi:MAG: hypothetical protein R3263_02810, partial [Myxococcota bacterium]|nr:hypothetical protein [Myxococcota bacterium]